MATNFEKLAAQKTITAGYPQRIDGTEGDDFILVYGNSPTFVNALGGDDTISTFGDQTHVIYGGDGNDTININGDGPVMAHGQGDDDRFNINTRASHGAFGGEGYDIADFSGIYGTLADMGAVFDLGAGTVENWPFLSSFQMTMSGIEEVIGTSGIDHVTGSDQDDNYHAGAGSDFFYGGAGNDTFTAADDGSEADGGTGNDTFNGGAGSDTFYGGEGHDVMYGGDGWDTIDGGGGNDVIYDDSGRIDAGSGDDYVVANGGGSLVIAGAGADYVSVGHDNYDNYNHVYANSATGERDSSDDEFHGLAGDTLSYAGSDVGVYVSSALGVAFTRFSNDASIGVDHFTGFTQFHGSSHDDFMRTSNTSQYWAAREVIRAGEGDDLIYASSGNDIYYGGNNDWTGETGSDTVDYSSFQTSVTVDLSVNQAWVGGYQHLVYDMENVVGSQAHDTISGDDADNRIDGGEGNDLLTGNGGGDTFIFARGPGGSVGGDQVMDFESGVDTLMIDDLTLWDGTNVAGAADLDRNGDGTVDDLDGTASINGNGTFLLFQEGTILVRDVYGIDVNDMIFA